MSIIRHRSSDRLSNLLQEENDDIHGDIVGPTNGQSTVSTNSIIVKSTGSLPNLMSTSSSSAMASTSSTTTTTATATISFTITTYPKKASISPSKSIISHNVGLLALLGFLTILHIHQSSTSSAFMTYRTLITNGDMSFLASTSSSLKEEKHNDDDDDDDDSSTTLVDIVSVGSMTKSDFQTAQEETFRTHPNVRNFYRITEQNDTDHTCHSNLTYTQLQQIIKYCKNRRYKPQLSATSSLLRRLVYHPKNHTGWMCAQKRPIDGLHIALQQYVNNNKEIRIPNYLFIIDDDTYINMNVLMNQLLTNHTETTITTTHTSKQPQLITGCRYNYPQKEHFLFPYGGFGTILSRTVIRNLIQPIHCNFNNSNNNKDTRRKDEKHFGFVQSACWRLEQNLMGELQYFQDGMSIGDLMYIYAKQLSFTQMDAWKNGHGFCFHSDHALGYFFGYYHVAVPEEQFTLALQNTSLYDTMRYDYGYVNLVGPTNSCKQVKTRCSTKSSICHYTVPEQMRWLFRRSNEQLQEEEDEE